MSSITITTPEPAAGLETVPTNVVITGEGNTAEVVLETAADKPAQEGTQEAAGRPSWLPEGFDTPEAFADAYEALKNPKAPEAEAPAAEAVVAAAPVVDEAAITAEIETLAGGKETLESMFKWAANALPQETIDGINDVLTNGDAFTRKLALDHVKAQFEASLGSSPERVTGAAIPKVSGPKGFESIGEMQAAMSDPRYEKDDAYRKRVEQRVISSNLF